MLTFVTSSSPRAGFASDMLGLTIHARTIQLNVRINQLINQSIKQSIDIETAVKSCTSYRKLLPRASLAVFYFRPRTIISRPVIRWPQKSTSGYKAAFIANVQARGACSWVRFCTATENKGIAPSTAVSFKFMEECVWLPCTAERQGSATRCHLMYSLRETYLCYRCSLCQSHLQTYEVPDQGRWCIFSCFQTSPRLSHILSTRR